MPVGVTYPDPQHPNICNKTIDVREARVTDPFNIFAGKTKEIFVLEVY